MRLDDLLSKNRKDTFDKGVVYPAPKWPVDATEIIGPSWFVDKILEAVDLLKSMDLYKEAGHQIKRIVYDDSRARSERIGTVFYITPSFALLEVPYLASALRHEAVHIARNITDPEKQEEEETVAVKEQLEFYYWWLYSQEKREVPENEIELTRERIRWLEEKLSEIEAGKDNLWFR